MHNRREGYLILQKAVTADLMEQLGDICIKITANEKINSTNLTDRYKGGATQDLAANETLHCAMARYGGPALFHQ